MSFTTTLSLHNLWVILVLENRGQDHVTCREYHEIELRNHGLSCLEVDIAVYSIQLVLYLQGYLMRTTAKPTASSVSPSIVRSRFDIRLDPGQYVLPSNKSYATYLISIVKLLAPWFPRPLVSKRPHPDTCSIFPLASGALRLLTTTTTTHSLPLSRLRRGSPSSKERPKNTASVTNR